jgi:hypothetical protein
MELISASQMAVYSRIGWRHVLSVSILLAGHAYGVTAPELSTSFLLGADDLIEPAQSSAYAPGASDGSSDFVIQGRLTFDPVPNHSHFTALRDDYGLVRARSMPAREMPRFDVELIQVGADIVPVNRGAVISGHPAWDVIVEPGKTWLTEIDHGYARVALPFALIERNANCTHNGLLTFLLDRTGKTSRAAYQITSETCAYLQFDLWGIAHASFVPGVVAQQAQIESSYRSELSARLPVRPLSDLSNFGVNTSRLLQVDKASVTAYGLLAFGTHYTGACLTRYGDYPYCDVLTLPSFSLAKSAVAGLSYLRLSYLYPELSSSLVSDHVPACSALGQWKDVTISQVLDMATGNFDSSIGHVDEGAEKMSSFFLTETHKEKIEYGCSAYQRHLAPGTAWVYHTSDTYVAGAHMDSYFRSKTYATADVFRDIVVDQLFKPLRLSPNTWEMRRTLDAVAQPFYGWGMTMHRDDIVRIADFLMTSNGQFERQTYFNSDDLAAVLQRNPDRRGLVAGNPDLRYQKGFWGIRLVTSDKCEAWVSFMSGYGGITVAMLPNGVVYYSFSDGNDFRWKEAALETDKLVPLCKGKPT